MTPGVETEHGDCGPDQRKTHGVRGRDGLAVGHAHKKLPGWSDELQKPDRGQAQTACPDGEQQQRQYGKRPGQHKQDRELIIARSKGKLVLAGEERGER